MEGNPAALQGATPPRCLSRLRAVALPPGPRGTAALLSLRVQRYWRLHRGCADRASNKHRSLASQIVSAAAFSLFKKDVRYWQILLQKSFCTRDQNFFWLYRRLPCKYVGDLIVRRKTRWRPR